MNDGAQLLEGEVRRALRAKGSEELPDASTVRELVARLARDYDLRSLTEPLPPLGDLERVGQHVIDAVLGLGPLQPFMDDPSVEEIWLNGPEQVFVARGGVSELTSVRLGPDELPALVERMLAHTHRRVDLSSPFVDAALPDGSRLHVAIPDVTRNVWYVNIRKFVTRVAHLSELVARDSLTPEAADFLDAAVRHGLNILVSGATQAGKTTMLNCLAGSIPARERVVTAEEVFELRLPLRDIVSLQCRPPALDGGGEISLRRLVKEALRMRPDRIVVGEVREAESFDLLVALNAGLPGLCTLHANGAREALTKLCTLPLLAGENISAAFVAPTVASCIDVIVHCTKEANGRRTVGEIAMVGSLGKNGVIELRRVFSRSGGGTLNRHHEADLSHPKWDHAGAPRSGAGVSG